MQQQSGDECFGTNNCLIGGSFKAGGLEPTSQMCGSAAPAPAARAAGGAGWHSRATPKSPPRVLGHYVTNPYVCTHTYHR